MHSLVELLPASFMVCFVNTSILSFILVSYEQSEQAASLKFPDFFSLQ